MGRQIRRKTVAVPEDAAEPEDLTPLAGARIDIRPAWLAVRTWRSAEGMTLRSLCTGPGRPRIRLRPCRVGDQAPATARPPLPTRRLGLHYGALRSSIDVLCRTFDYAPADQAPYVPEPALEAFSPACEVVAGSPTGHDWLRFAEHHTAGEFGLPDDAMLPHVARLASEVERTNGSAYRLRYERSPSSGAASTRTLSWRSSEAVARPGQAAPLQHVQRCLGEPDAQLARWCGQLLTNPSPSVAHAACLAIQNMRSVGGLATSEWLKLAPVYAAACDRAYGDAQRAEILASTLATCAKPFRDAVHELVRRPLPPVPRPAWSRQGEHYAYATAMAEEAAEGRPGAPLLGRLIFELLYDFRLTHVVTSSFVLGASVFAPRIQSLLHDAALNGPDALTRHGAAYAFASLMLPPGPIDPMPWLASDDPVIRRRGLVIAGYAATPMPSSTLHELLDDDRTRNEAIVAAGMTAHPDLTLIASDEAPAELRAAAQWWLAEGGAVIDDCCQ